MKYYDVDGVLYRVEDLAEKYIAAKNQWVLASRAKARLYGMEIPEKEARKLWPDAF